MSKKKYIINGKTFIGQSSMLHYFNLSRDIFYRRIKNGESLKKALRPKEGKLDLKLFIIEKKSQNILKIKLNYMQKKIRLKN